MQQLAPSMEKRPAFAQTRRHAGIYSLSALIVAVMVAWFVLLGWGLVEISHWLYAFI
jgi:hypothetical protein